ncbi:MAG: sulfatase-like hydrolase/transferase, partial [Planctomycetes bacterium]|nr:sulfatase-like hydrolase/transferase [Planctomycetota bacterium]
LTDRLNIEAVEFIERHKDEPFFLYKSHYAVHTRLNGKPELVAKYENKPGAGKGFKAKKNNPHLAAQLETIDEGVGMIVAKLEELDLAKNTVIVFMSDNGGESGVTSNAPLRAGKSTLYEGGIREPLIVCWPGKVAPNKVCDVPVCSIDFYPTLCEMASVRPAAEQHLDGLSFAALLRGQKTELDRDALYWHYPIARPHFLGGRSGGAVRRGDWKLIEFYDTGEIELYNVVRDIGEKHNLAAKQPEEVARLQKLLADWRKDVGAIFPPGQPTKNSDRS